MPKRLTALGFAFRRFAVPGRVGARVFGLNIGCRYSTPVRKRPLHPTRSQFKPEPSQTQAPVTPATEPERRAGGSLTTSWEGVRRSGDGEAAALVAMIEAMRDICLGRSALGEAEIVEMKRIAPDLMPSLVGALKSWSARGRSGDCAEAGADGAYGPKVIPFPGMGGGRS